jgi:hypothetical protein
MAIPEWKDFFFLKIGQIYLPYGKTSGSRVDRRQSLLK